MGTLWWIPFSAGFEDGLDPCALMTVAIVIVLYLWLRRGLKPGKFLGLFFAGLIILNLVFNLGFFIQIWASPAVQKVSVVLYKILAVGFLGLGAVFFYDWVLLIKGKDPQVLLSRRLFNKNATLKKGQAQKAIFMMIAAALIVSLISTVWAPNYYISMIANNFLVPGRRWETVFLLMVYTVVELWLALVLAAVLRRGKLSVRLEQLVFCAVFLVAGGSALYFFGVI